MRKEMEALNFPNTQPLLYKTLCELEVTSEAGKASFDTVYNQLMSKFASNEPRPGIMTTFQNIDRDNTDTLNSENIKDIAKQSSQEISSDQADEIVKNAASNGK